jgi:hypothetical protein
MQADVSENNAGGGVVEEHIIDGVLGNIQETTHITTYNHPSLGYTMFLNVFSS